MAADYAVHNISFDSRSYLFKLTNLYLLRNLALVRMEYLENLKYTLGFIKGGICEIIGVKC